MRSRYSHILIVLAAILAFVPILAVGPVIEGYVKARELDKLQASADALTRDSQRVTLEAIGSLRRILAASPSLCTPTFRANVIGEIRANLYLREVTVEDRAGGQSCAAPGGTVSYRPLSESLAVPGHTETVSAVELEGFAYPVLRIAQAFGPDRTVSAFVVAAPLLARPAETLSQQADWLRISLTNGTPLLEQGTQAGSRGLLAARSFAGEIPLRADIGVSLSSVRAGYAPLELGLSIAASAMGLAVLILALQYVRRSQLPAFDLERAIAAGELKPFYQPVIDLRTGRITGCEVLIRWIKRDGEIVPPGAFIDYAEMTDLAIPMTLNLMEQVRADLDALCRANPEFKVAINLFEGHFRDGSVVEDVQSIFADSGISYTQLVFEITERRPLDDRAAVNRVVTAFHKLGVRVAMDDAGTGHSNLAYLQTLGIDIVKIDRIFVEMIKSAEEPAPVIDGLISMAHDMGIEIVAEGVETRDQAIYLRERGVESAQGFLFAAPMKASSFLAFAEALAPRRRAGDGQGAEATLAA